MKNSLWAQLFVIVFLFFGTWYLLSRVDWMTLLKVEKATQKTEQKLGDLFWDIIKKTEHEIKSPLVIAPIDSLINRICTSNDIDRNQIKFHLIEKDEVNAFALPNHHLVIYTGLIRACDNEAELCGVIGHEIAHMENSHVMKKLVKEIGLATLLSMAGGNAGSEIIKQGLKILSSSAYDRALESEADMVAVDYMINADIDPEAFANLLYRFSKDDGDLPEQFYWVSTHPDSEARAHKIVQSLTSRNYQKSRVLSDATWQALQARLIEK